LPLFTLLPRIPYSWLALSLAPDLLIAATLAHCYADGRRLDRRIVPHYSATLRDPAAARAYARTATALRPRVAAPVVQGIRRLRVPALILHGLRDQVIPTRTAERLHQEIPDSQLHLLQNVGHFPQEEAPDLVLARLLPFLARVVGSGGATGG
jgi:pimeloyl-ACP methyl ester carboxylesterase